MSATILPLALLAVTAITNLGPAADGTGLHRVRPVAGPCAAMNHIDESVPWRTTNVPFFQWRSGVCDFRRGGEPRSLEIVYQIRNGSARPIEVVTAISTVQPSSCDDPRAVDHVSESGAMSNLRPGAVQGDEGGGLWIMSDSSHYSGRLWLCIVSLRYTDVPEDEGWVVTPVAVRERQQRDHQAATVAAQRAQQDQADQRAAAAAQRQQAAQQAAAAAQAQRQAQIDALGRQMAAANAARQASADNLTNGISGLLTGLLASHLQGEARRELRERADREQQKLVEVRTTLQSGDSAQLDQLHEELQRDAVSEDDDAARDEREADSHDQKAQQNDALAEQAAQARAAGGFTMTTPGSYQDDAKTERLQAAIARASAGDHRGRAGRYREAASTVGDAVREAGSSSRGMQAPIDGMASSGPTTRRQDAPSSPRPQSTAESTSPNSGSSSGLEVDPVQRLAWRHTWRELIMSAAAARVEHQVDSMELFARAANAVDPTRPQGWFMVAEAFLERGIVDSARTNFDRALHAATDSSQSATDVRQAAAFQAGVLAYNAHDYRAAVAEFSAAVRLKADDDDARRNLAAALRESGLADSAARVNGSMTQAATSSPQSGVRVSEVGQPRTLPSGATIWMDRPLHYGLGYVASPNITLLVPPEASPPPVTTLADSADRMWHATANQSRSQVIQIARKVLNVVPTYLDAIRYLMGEYAGSPSYQDSAIAVGRRLRTLNPFDPWLPDVVCRDWGRTPSRSDRGLCRGYAANDLGFGETVGFARTDSGAWGGFYAERSVKFLPDGSVRGIDMFPLMLEFLGDDGRPVVVAPLCLPAMSARELADSIAAEKRRWPRFRPPEVVSTGIFSVTVHARGIASWRARRDDSGVACSPP